MTSSTTYSPPAAPRPSSRLPLYCLLLLLLLLLPLSLCLLPSSPLYSSSLLQRAPFRALASLFRPTAPLQPLQSPPAPVSALSTCPRLATLSAARHGSTWFTDSVDACRYSAHVSETDPAPQVYSPDVFAASELWSIHPGPLQAATPLQAADYIVNNASVKILAPHAVVRSRSVKAFLEQLRNRKIPVVLLRRDLGQAFASLEEAMASGEWNVIRKPGMRRESVAEGEQWEQYRDEMEKYFRASAELLKVVGVPFDEIWYEDVVTQEHIWLKKAACYVRNCNFRR